MAVHTDHVKQFTFLNRAPGYLVDLNELFTLYWRRSIPLGQTSSIVFHFFRLDR